MAPTTTTTATPTRPACDVNYGQVCENEHGLLEEDWDHDPTASDCQAICQNHPECGFYSHYTEADGHEHWGVCRLYRSCDRLTDHECFDSNDHECNDGPMARPGKKCNCMSGPPQPDLDECGDQPPTPSPCLSDFWPGLKCDEHDNTIQHIENIPDVSDCQAICQNHAGCEYFSHFYETGGKHKADCWLHYQCDHLVDRECERGECFCGPAYPDLDDCSEAP